MDCIVHGVTIHSSIHIYVKCRKYTHTPPHTHAHRDKFHRLSDLNLTHRLADVTSYFTGELLKYMKVTILNSQSWG